MTAKVGSFELEMPRGHALRNNLAMYPQYGRNLQRLARIISGKYKVMSVIDVGANIGDTAALVRSVTDCPIVCIEGDPVYFGFLQRNSGLIGNILPLQHFLDASAHQSCASLIRARGTTSLDDASPCDQRPKTSRLEFTTLDVISADRTDWFDAAHLLKIDTDGYDLRVMKGARKLIGSFRPVLFIECSERHLSMAGDSCSDVFEFIEAVGYRKLAVYDNYGRFLLSVDTADRTLLSQISAYIHDGRGGFPYCDVAAFVADDADVAQLLVSEEREINIGGPREILEPLQLLRHG